MKSPFSSACQHTLERQRRGRIVDILKAAIVSSMESNCAAAKVASVEGIIAVDKFFREVG